MHSDIFNFLTEKMMEKPNFGKREQVISEDVAKDILIYFFLCFQIFFRFRKIIQSLLHTHLSQKFQFAKHFM